MSDWSEAPKSSSAAERAQYRCVVQTERYRYTRRRWRILMHLLDAVGGLLFPFRSVWKWISRRWQGEREVRSILLIQLDHLGDAVLSSGLLHGLRRRFPNAQIDVLASDRSAAWYEFAGEANQVWVMPQTRFGRGTSRRWIHAVFAWGLWMRRRRYDLAIDIRGELPNALLIWLTGARRRIGWTAGGGGYLLTDSGNWQYGRHEVLSRQELLALAVNDTESELVSLPRYRASEEVQRHVHERLEQSDTTATRRIVVHLGSGMPGKVWPVAHWRSLIRRLDVHLDAHVVVVGGAADNATAKLVAGEADALRVSNWTGRTGVAELVALCEHADLFIGSDSGPAHIAAQCGTPTLVLFSGTNRVDQWRPWGPHVVVVKHVTECSPCHREVCPLADHPCMQNLRPDEVFAAAARMLKVPVRGHARPHFSMSDLEPELPIHHV